MEIKALILTASAAALWQTAVPPEINILAGAERLTLVAVLLAIVRELWLRNKDREAVIEKDHATMTAAFTENIKALTGMKDAITGLTESIDELKSTRQAIEDFRRSVEQARK